jgi:hypothetical protein
MDTQIVIVKAAGGPLDGMEAVCAIETGRVHFPYSAFDDGHTHLYEADPSASTDQIMQWKYLGAVSKSDTKPSA